MLTGSTSVRIPITITDATGAALTGQLAADLAFLYSINGGTGVVIATPVLQEKGNGEYSILVPNAAWASPNAVIKFYTTTSNKIVWSKTYETVGIGGALPFAITFKDADDNVVPYVRFSIVGIGAGRANVSGVASIGLDAGSYTLVPAPTSGVVFESTTIVVSEVLTSQEIEGTSVVHLPSDDPERARCFLRCVKASGAINPDGYVTFELMEKGDADAWNASRIVVSCNADGEILDPDPEEGVGILLALGLEYRGHEGSDPPVGSDKWVTFTVEEDGQELPAMIGKET